MPEFTGTRDLRSYLAMAWRWKFLILFFVIAAPLGAYGLASRTQKTYTASTLVGVNNATVNSSVLSSGGSFSTSNVEAIARLVTTSPVAQTAASLMRPPANPAEIAGEVTAVGDQTTQFLTITATDRDPERAGVIANAFARALTLNRQAAAVNQVQDQIKGIQRQMKRLGPKDTQVRLQLQQQLVQLQTSLATTGSAAAILQPAGRGAPTGTSTRSAVLIGLIIGILLSFGAVAVAESADRRLRTPDDLERMAGLPLMASIPPSVFSGELETKPIDNEAFSMLRASLMFFNVDRRLESVIITSAGEEEGKTTIATRLAITAARAGQHVILVDADLRRAQVSARLGIRAPEGLGAVLAEGAALHDVLVDYPLETVGDGSLTVVPAGPPPPNAPALLSSHLMEKVLRDLEAESDLVIIDTPAALAVSDSIPLMRLVTGVVLVARMNRSSRETIRRLKAIITSAHGNLLGVVATGVGAGAGYDTLSPKKYYTSNGTNGSHPKGRRFKVGRRKQAGITLTPAKAAGDAADKVRPAVGEEVDAPETEASPAETTAPTE